MLEKIRNKFNICNKHSAVPLKLRDQLQKNK